MGLSCSATVTWWHRSHKIPCRLKAGVECLWTLARLPDGRTSGLGRRDRKKAAVPKYLDGYIVFLFLF